MLYKYGKHTRDFLGLFNFYFSLVFYLLRVFLIKKKLFHSHLLDMDDYSQLGAMRLVAQLPSHI